MQKTVLGLVLDFDVYLFDVELVRSCDELRHVVVYVVDGYVEQECVAEWQASTGVGRGTSKKQLDEVDLDGVQVVLGLQRQVLEVQSKVLAEHRVV